MKHTMEFRSLIMIFVSIFLVSIVGCGGKSEVQVTRTKPMIKEKPTEEPEEFITQRSIDEKDVVKVRSEGAQLVKTQKSSAKNNAIQLAVEKAVVSEVDALTQLSLDERKKVISKIKTNPKSFIANYELIDETEQAELLRVILDVGVLPVNLVDTLIEMGLARNLKHKPRIMVALTEKLDGKVTEEPILAPEINQLLLKNEFKPLSPELAKKASKVMSEGLDAKGLAKLGKKFHCDVIISGSVNLVKMPQSTLIKSETNMRSYQANGSISATRCDTADQLFSVPVRGKTMSVTAETAAQRIYPKTVRIVSNRLMKDLLRRWVIDVATARAVPQPDITAGNPPSLKVNTPVDRAVTDESSVMLRAEAVDDDAIEGVKLFVNDVAVSVKVGQHLMPGSKDQDEAPATYQISRMVTLKEGENKLKLVVSDSDAIQVEQTLTVFREVEKAEQASIIIFDPSDGEVIKENSVTLSGMILSKTAVSEAKIFVNEREQQDTHFEESIASSEDDKFYSIGSPISLNQEQNVIKISVIAGGVRATKYLTVTSQQDAQITSTPEVATEDTENDLIQIKSPSNGDTIYSDTVRVIGYINSEVKVKVEVNINEIGTRDLTLIKREKPNVIDHEIHLAPGENTIQVTAKNSDSEKLATREIRVTRVLNTYRGMDRVIETASSKYAVIVGIGNYKDPNIPDLRFTRNDAESIYELLTTRGGFPESNVRRLIDENATLENIKSTLTDWLSKEAKEDDMVFLFYSGHGGVDNDLTGEEPDGKSKFMIPYDADLKNLRETALLNSHLSAMLDGIGSSKFLFMIDCCYSGGFVGGGGIRMVSPPNVQGEVSSNVYKQLSGYGRVVVSASQANQVSFEIEDLKHGIFTYYLLESLEGNADFNKDQGVSLVELYLYLQQKVSQASRDRVGRSQDPSFMGSITGDLTLVELK